MSELGDIAKDAWNAEITRQNELDTPTLEFDKCWEAAVNSVQPKRYSLFHLSWSLFLLSWVLFLLSYV